MSLILYCSTQAFENGIFSQVLLYMNVMWEWTPISVYCQESTGKLHPPTNPSLIPFNPIVSILRLQSDFLPLYLEVNETVCVLAILVLSGSFASSTTSLPSPYLLDQAQVCLSAFFLVSFLAFQPNYHSAPFAYGSLTEQHIFSTYILASLSITCIIYLVPNGCKN